MKKLKIAVATLGLCMLMTPQTVLAGQWKTDANGWWYQNDDGSYPANCWQWIDGNGDGTAECYYFNESGYMLSNTTTPDGYIVNQDGAWIENGVVKTTIVDVTQPIEPEKSTLKISEPNNAWSGTSVPFLYRKNSADGISVYWDAINQTGKTINYYTPTVWFYNAVGDPAYDEITKLPYKQVRVVGPVEPNGHLYLANIMGYVPTCSKVTISEIINVSLIKVPCIALFLKFNPDFSYKI